MINPPEPNANQSKPLHSEIASSAEAGSGFTSSWSSILGHNVHALVSDKQTLLPGSRPWESSNQIVMIHGALASHRYLMPAAELLAQHLQVFVPELPGHGASSTPPHALSVEEHSDILFEWFGSNNLKRAHVFANSYGCQIAVHLAAKHPEIIDRLILTGPTVDPAAPTVVQQIYNLLLDALGEPTGTKRQFFRDLYDMSIPIVCETVQRMMENDIKPVLPSIKCRTLVLRGEKDTIASQEWTEEVARCISKAELIVIPEAPHCVNFATPAKLTDIVLQFLKEP